jgi:hypothetical protein
VQEKELEKLSPGGRAWMATAEKGARLAAMLLLARSPTKDDLARLEALGVEIVSLSGDVATARIRRDVLENVLAEQVVTFVEASRPLTAE